MKRLKIHETLVVPADGLVFEVREEGVAVWVPGHGRFWGVPSGPVADSVMAYARGEQMFPVQGEVIDIPAGWAAGAAARELRDSASETPGIQRLGTFDSVMHPDGSMTKTYRDPEVLRIFSADPEREFEPVAAYAVPPIPIRPPRPPGISPEIDPERAARAMSGELYRERGEE